MFAVIWFQVFLSNTNNFQFDPLIGPLMGHSGGPGSNGNEGELYITQSSLTGNSPSGAV